MGGEHWKGKVKFPAQERFKVKKKRKVQHRKCKVKFFVMGLLDRTWGTILSNKDTPIYFWHQATLVKV